MKGTNLGEFEELVLLMVAALHDEAYGVAILENLEEKLQKKVDKKDQETSGSLDDMIAYVDEFGNILDEPPEEPKISDKNKKA